VDINKTFIVHSDRQQPAGHSAAQIGAGGQQRDQQPCDCDQRRERAIRAGLTGAMFDHPIWKMGAGNDREPPTGLRLSNLMALLMVCDY
jgi:hypothetical protein